MIDAEDISLCKKDTEFLCKEQWAANLPRISHSSRDLFVACRQAFYYYKVCGIRAKDQYASTPIKLGSIWDEFIQYAYDGKSFMGRFAELVEHYEVDQYDAARLEAMFRAYHMLEITNEPNGTNQKLFEFITPVCVVNGIVDVAYDNGFEEHKFSGSPDWYTVPYNVAPQVATYFLSDPNYKLCVMKVVRKPGHRPNTKDNEQPDEFCQRILSDVLSRPSYYFLGFSRSSTSTSVATYGINYYRDEFTPLDDILEDYNMVSRDILRAINDHSFYQNRMNCYKFGADNACQYLSICDTRSVDEDVFEINVTNTSKGGDTE